MIDCRSGGDSPLAPSALSPPIATRLHAWLSRHWPKESRKLSKDGERQLSRVPVVGQVMGATGVDCRWANVALLAVKGDPDLAIMALDDIDIDLLNSSICTLGRNPVIGLDHLQQEMKSVPLRELRLIGVLCHWDVNVAIALMQVERIRTIVIQASNEIIGDDFRTSLIISTISVWNPFARVTEELLERLLTLNETCYECNGPLPVITMRLGICESELCNHQFEECGLGFSLEEELCCRPELCDLLISMCGSASKTGRLSVFFPKTLKDPISSKSLTTSAEDLRQIGNILDRCPPIKKLAKHIQSGTLIEELRQCHPLLPLLLRWIIASNRSHIRYLSGSERIVDIAAKHQFVLLTASPEKEAMFRAHINATRSKEVRVRYAFHGSPRGNWHSIVRQGLQNMSGTKNMLHGAAFGSGVYMAQDIRTSLGYSQSSSDAWKNSMFGQDWQALALCEVANIPKLQNYSYWVVPDADMIVTRYLFIFKPPDILRQDDVDTATQFGVDIGLEVMALMSRIHADISY